MWILGAFVVFLMTVAPMCSAQEKIDILEPRMVGFMESVYRQQVGPNQDEVKKIGCVSHVMSLKMEYNSFVYCCCDN